MKNKLDQLLESIIEAAKKYEQTIIEYVNALKSDQEISFNDAKALDRFVRECVKDENNGLDFDKIKSCVKFKIEAAINEKLDEDLKNNYKNKSAKGFKLTNS